MAMFFTDLEGTEFKSSPEGLIHLRCEELGPEPVAEIGISAVTADRPEEAMPARVVMVQYRYEGVNFVAECPIVSIEGLVKAVNKSHHFQCTLKITNRLARGAYSVSVFLRSPAGGNPRFLIPGIFYKHNRPAKCNRKYPGYTPEPSKDAEDPFLGPEWSFRSDRCAEPAVFGWTDDLSLAMAAPPVFDKGQSGVFFSAKDGRMEIGVNFPYREEPAKYSFCYETGTAPERTFFYMNRGEAFSVTFDLAIGKRDLHGYAPFLRTIYERDRSAIPTRPWMDADHACQLASYGLYKWHYDREESALWETCSFDRYFGKKNGYVDRASMHTAWVSGAPTAMAQLWQGRAVKNDDYLAAGTRVLDKIASGTGLTGTFFPCLVSGKGWTGGWNPRDNWAQARTCAEATLFLLRALRLELSYGAAHHAWGDAVRKSLDFAVKIQRADGHLGSYYNMDTGEVEEWEGAGGLLWTAALIGGSVFFGEPRYREAAIRAGHCYASYLEDEFLYGAPEDVHLTPTSEDGYNALISYTLLGEITREEEWLKMAKAAADWLLTFRFTYNTRLPQFSILSQYDFRTKGGDVASPSNQHLHFYGLVCHPELMKLGQYLKDDYYIRRATEHLEFCHQFIARDDGDFGARKGMVPEQFYHTDWWQPKGHLLALSHAWCAGLLLYANLWEKECLKQSTIRLNQPDEPGTTPTHGARTARVPTTSGGPTTEEMPPSERETLFDL